MRKERQGRDRQGPATGEIASQVWAEPWEEGRRPVLLSGAGRAGTGCRSVSGTSTRAALGCPSGRGGVCRRLGTPAIGEGPD